MLVGKVRIGGTCGRGIVSGRRRAVGRFVSTEHRETRCSFGFDLCSTNSKKD